MTATLDPTVTVQSWLNFEEPAASRLMNLVNATDRPGMSRAALVEGIAAKLRAQVYIENPLGGTRDLYADLLRGALNAVDWPAVVEMWLEVVYG